MPLRSDRPADYSSSPDTRRTVSKGHEPALNSSTSTESAIGSLLWVLAILAGLAVTAWATESVPGCV